MARKNREEVNLDGWKDTYGDMVTLLLCFFVLLYSMSAVDSEKWQAFVRAFTNPGDDTAQVVLVPGEEPGEHLVPGEGGSNQGTVPETTEFPTDFDQLYEYLKDYAESQGMQDSVEISAKDGAVYVRYQNSLFFAPDSAALLPEAMPSLEFLGGCLKSLEDQLWLVSISGHTASVAVENYSVSDWLLSSERASNVAIYFEEQSGLRPQLLRPIGFGKNYPIDTNDTPEGRERNRRVELVIVSKDSSIAQSDLMSGAVSGLIDPDKFPQAGDFTGIEDVLDPQDEINELVDSLIEGGEPTAQPPAGEDAAASLPPEGAGAASLPPAGEDAAASLPPEDAGTTPGQEP